MTLPNALKNRTVLLVGGPLNGETVVLNNCLYEYHALVMPEVNILEARNATIHSDDRVKRIRYLETPEDPTIFVYSAGIL